MAGSGGGAFEVGAGAPNRGNALEVGDELRQIAMKFPGATVLADADRSRAAQHAVGRYNAEVLLLDDGFQHRSLARDLDIVLIDVTQPLHSQHMLPAGLRREPVSSLRRAGLLVYTRVDGNWHPDIQAMEIGQPGLQICFKPSGLRRLEGNDTLSVQELAGKSIVAFCGIGNPDAFFGTLKGLGAIVHETIAFPDHHWYNAGEIERLIESSQIHDAILVTTEKDAVRFDAAPELPHELSIHVLEIRTVIVRGENLLAGMIETILAT